MRCRGLQGLAIPHIQRVSFPCLALCCTVLRSRWSQSGVNRGNSCFTILLPSGTRPAYIQKLLGHSSVQLTLDRYSH